MCESPSADWAAVISPGAPTIPVSARVRAADPSQRCGAGIADLAGDAAAISSPELEAAIITVILSLVGEQNHNSLESCYSLCT
jgi:hypothetical protein